MGKTFKVTRYKVEGREKRCGERKLCSGVAVRSACTVVSRNARNRLSAGSIEEGGTILSYCVEGAGGVTEL